MPNNSGYIVAAYAVTWLVLVAYAARLFRVTRRARAQYAEAGRGAEAGR